MENQKKILMHVCCGPCAEWPVEAIRAEGFSPDAYFYNPNIHPQAEHDKRLFNMRKMAEKHKIKLFEDDKSDELYWRSLDKLSKEEHCQICYRLRLFEAARFAKEHGYPYMTTSLQVSPYQDQSLIETIAREACQKYGVNFISRNFKENFRLGQDMAKEDELYRQKYCGCIYSLNETHPKFKAKVLKEYGLQEADLPVRVQSHKPSDSDHK